ncbi:MAG TPA: hypothetical protein VJH22_03015 [Candidatus Nanoarchaeia archaeon]|nr:hypothetical protein [Candidatus Nanoarchaeia archaeon]
MVRLEKRYQCEICNQSYVHKKDAVECEEIGRPQPLLSPGSLIKITKFRDHDPTYWNFWLCINSTASPHSCDYTMAMYAPEGQSEPNNHKSFDLQLADLRKRRRIVRLTHQEFNSFFDIHYIDTPDNLATLVQHEHRIEIFREIELFKAKRK